MNIDLIIVVGFLLANLVIGLYYGKGIKSIKEYALGGRNFSTAALVATMIATWASGSGFFITISKTYSDGLVYVIAVSFMAFQAIILAYFFIPRMRRFLGVTSIAEAMGGLYGDKVRIIIAICGSVDAIGYIAVQYKAFGNIFSYFFGFPSYFAVIIAGLIVTIYSAFGGIKSVTFTDVLQFITFGIAIPLIGILIWNQLNFDVTFSLARAFDDPKFNFSDVFSINNPKFWPMIALALYFLMPGMDPVVCQRIMMGRNIKQITKVFVITAIILFLIKIALAWIPFLIFNVNPDIEPSKLLAYIIDNYTYTGFKGLIIIGVIALAMSTADSHINSASVLFANDFCRVLKIGNNRELLLSRSFAVFLGIGAILLALHTEDLLACRATWILVQPSVM